jgi:hypothetical protein
MRAETPDQFAEGRDGQRRVVEIVGREAVQADHHDHAVFSRDLCRGGPRHEKREAESMNDCDSHQTPILYRRYN